MTLSEIKKHLKNLDTIAFILPDGSLVPNHFHVTEVGKTTKHFIDCGGTIRQEKKVNFQLWNANDYDHRLHPEKLIHIIELSEDIFNLKDLEIEVEYQGEQSIQKFGLDFKDGQFLLTSTQTNCLAKDKCGIPEKQLPKPKVKLADLNNEPCCSPDGNCC
ncbi:hypothetical protein FHS04_000161 [Mesoflavibacter sabulilitoris]|uniref:Uncharacterized protein n=1 Tax=Mesoflavibacter zeaxanthinifaciens subsp. sabulilitoris TaxID=1520893 RepID=A0A2T1NHC8_9FLAO|nr:DUF6428 family protein [Mesoflavibacter zeaxanthinifaciens]MBB3122673.1 hypothetical protein [Mesoflavibacter zeaxanthinifaciens subsp. sabulilitoris]PSG92279.1 hypothetical protein C7H61_06580 [Mesoflavibacter zeaxanthinifaciens subsp. sabulilitoris]